MKHSEFKIGLEFWLGGNKWRCTDVGTRTVIAIKLDRKEVDWYFGPTYPVAETVLDEDDLPVCSVEWVDWRTQCKGKE